MSNSLDLDALIADVDSRPAAAKVALLKRSTFDALVSRLREAEALTQRIGVNELEHDLYRRLKEAQGLSKHLEKMAFQWQSVALENRARIAQLERVREAVATFKEALYAYEEQLEAGIPINMAQIVIDHDRTRDAMFAALAAVGTDDNGA